MVVKIEPASARYSIRNTLNGVRASVPSRKNWFVVLFLCVWLFGWVMGETSAIGELFHLDIGFWSGFHSHGSVGNGPGQLFVVFWLVGWTFGGAAVVITLIWQLFGREIIGVEAGELIHRVEAFGVGRTRAFATAQVAHLRAVDTDSSVFSRRPNFAPVPFGRGSGCIAFDYGARSYRIGTSLDEAEGRLLIQQLKRWLPEGAVAA
jgi:hypothetical protein